MKIMTEKKQPLAVFYKKRVIKNFAEFIENTCVGVPFLTKLQARPLFPTDLRF